MKHPVTHPVAAVKSGATSVLSAWRAHPAAMLVGAMIFGAFLFPIVAGFLGRVKARGGALGAVVPNAFTRSA